MVVREIGSGQEGMVDLAEEGPIGSGKRMYFDRTCFWVAEYAGKIEYR